MKNGNCFGLVLRQLRIERGLSQEELAERLHISSNAHISRLENGKKIPSLDVLFRLADILGLKAWELIKIVEEKSHE